MGFYNSIIAAWKIVFIGIASLLSILFGAAAPQFASNPPIQVPQTTSTQPVPSTSVALATNQAPKTAAAAPASTSTPPAQTLPAQAQPPTAPLAFSDASGEVANDIARSSLVNILCTTRAGGSFNPISGSGVIIDTRGVILTNAHVGQFFLLRDYPVSDNVHCVIRTGSPAQPLYTAELLYLPPSWISANAQEITASTPTGTGENDYSLLLITGTTAPNGSLPQSFPALTLTLSKPSLGEEMLLAAYPAGLLGGTTIQENLYQSSAFATVDGLFSFSQEKHVDLFSLSSSVVSQNGSSGGVVLNPNGSLQGIVATADAGTTTQRALHAITLAHIDRSLKSAGLGGLQEFLLQPDLPEVAATFAQKTAPEETQALENVLTK